MPPAQVNRRTALGALAAAAFAPLALPSGTSRFETKYKYGQLILGPSNDPHAFDGKSVDFPFVFRHNQSFYMTYVAFDGTGYQTGLASSTDLVHWQREGCILHRDPSNEITRYNVALNWIVRENGLVSDGKLKRVQGQFIGAYHAYPNAGYEDGPAVIGLCRSPDLRHWTLDAPCLRPQDGADWERGGLYKPCLVEESGTYYLFYNAKTAEKRWHEQTGVAISQDLKTWQRHVGNPIIRNGGSGSWDERFASDPCVVKHEKGWALFYFGLDSKGVARDLLATGEDLLRFSKVPEILIDVGPPGSVDSTYAHKPSVIFHAGALYHFYCAVSGAWPNEVRGISVARSKPWSSR
jgi:predicted GH43/DUF377 family glycosyl hydrolase